MQDDGSLVYAGERIEQRLRYTEAQIAEFARLTHDHNPLHHDVAAARRAGFTSVIAAGQQTSANMMGLVASHYSRRDDGVARDMLCLNFNFAYKLPVFADQELLLAWKVSAAQWNGKLGGMLAHLDGSATVLGIPSVIGRGTILVRHGA